MEWQPIDTARRYFANTCLLGWSDGEHISCVGFWSEKYGMWIADRYRIWGGLREMRKHQPTHWMPLPEPPK